MEQCELFVFVCNVPVLHCHIKSKAPARHLRFTWAMRFTPCVSKTSSSVRLGFPLVSAQTALFLMKRPSFWAALDGLLLVGVEVLEAGVEVLVLLLVEAASAGVHQAASAGVDRDRHEVDCGCEVDCDRRDVDCAC